MLGGSVVVNLNGNTYNQKVALAYSRGPGNRGGMTGTFASTVVTASVGKGGLRTMSSSNTQGTVYTDGYTLYYNPGQTGSASVVAPSLVVCFALAIAAIVL